MPTWKATGCANSNIAFCKYWGNIDDELRIPVTGSISMNLDGLFTRTTVTFREDLATDQATLDGKIQAPGSALDRITKHLDNFRKLANVNYRAEVESASNFPVGAGIASSASAFAALTLAAAKALNLNLTEHELSALARLGSGSASRSVPGGFVEWYTGKSHESSYAASIAPKEHWALVDVIAIVNQGHKSVGSSEGHRTAATSPLQNARIETALQRVKQCRKAILERDFDSFADVVELDSNVMHAIMMTGSPALFYWQPTTLAIMQAVREMRADGIGVCYTIDAGPNVHCICAPEQADKVEEQLAAMTGIIETRRAGPGGPAFIEQE